MLDSWKVSSWVRYLVSFIIQSFFKVCDHTRFIGFGSTNVRRFDLRYPSAMLHHKNENTQRDLE